ncbi:MAG: peptidylprolyl isomerase, partial [Blastocatellia bacterium]
MKKILTAILLGIFAAGCSDKSTVNDGASTSSGPGGIPAPKAAGAPVFDDEVAVFETDMGNFRIALYPDVAPRHVENFKRLIREKFYDGLGFHRVIANNMIQGGDPQTRGGGNRDMWGMGDPGLPRVPAEFSTRPYKRGSIGMARTNDPNSASSQFFITLGPAPQWDGKYTVFGEVVQGIGNVEIISNAPVDGEKVKDLPVIKRAYLEKR